MKDERSSWKIVDKCASGAIGGGDFSSFCIVRITASLDPRPLDRYRSQLTFAIRIRSTDNGLQQRLQSRCASCVSRSVPTPVYLFMPSTKSFYASHAEPEQVYLAILRSSCRS